MVFAVGEGVVVEGGVVGALVVPIVLVFVLMVFGFGVVVAVMTLTFVVSVLMLLPNVVVVVGLMLVVVAVVPPLWPFTAVNIRLNANRVTKYFSNAVIICWLTRA